MCCTWSPSPPPPEPAGESPQAVGQGVTHRLGRAGPSSLDERLRHDGVSRGEVAAAVLVDLRHFLPGARVERVLEPDDLLPERPRLGEARPPLLSHRQAGQQALASYGLPGAFVALDPRNGEVLGLGSNPSFDPNIFTKPVSNETYRRLTSEDNESPLTNRAIQGLYPTGSTFKLVTTVAAMESGLLTPSSLAA